MVNTLKAALLAATIGLAGCGGGGGGGSGGGGTPPISPTASLFAGALQPAGARDGVGVAVQFNQPGGAAQDSAGTVYVADTGNHTIRKITTQGVVTTLAGSAGHAGSADGTGAAARFSSPRGLALDAAGNLYVADTGSNAVRKVSAAGVVTTVAQVDGPAKLALDGAGTVYVLSPTAVRKVAPDGSVTTFPVATGDGVGLPLPDSARRFSGITVDAAGNVFIAEAAPTGPAAPSGPFAAVGRIRKFSAQGGPMAFGNAAGGAVAVESPVDIAMEPGGSLLVVNNGFVPAGGSHSFYFRSVLRIAADGMKSIFSGVDNDVRTADGPAAVARFSDPRALAVGPAGRVAVVETLTNSIRVIDPQGAVTTLAGGDGTGAVDGLGPAARFRNPRGLAAAPDGSLYVADAGNLSVRRISPSGVVSTWMQTNDILVGGPVNVAVSATGTVYMKNPTNLAGRSVYTLSATGSVIDVYQVLGGSDALAVDSAGNVLVAEAGIVAVAPDGSKRIVASGLNVRSLAAGPGGQVYFITDDYTVADGNDFTRTDLSKVGVINPSGEVRILAGVAGQVGDADGAAGTARFRSLNKDALAVDAVGNVYVADLLRIRRIAPDGTVTTIADLATLDGVDLRRPLIGGLAWVSGALYASVQTAIVRIAPVN